MGFTIIHILYCTHEYVVTYLQGLNMLFLIVPYEEVYNGSIQYLKFSRVLLPLKVHDEPCRTNYCKLASMYDRLT